MKLFTKISCLVIALGAMNSVCHADVQLTPQGLSTQHSHEGIEGFSEDDISALVNDAMQAQIQSQLAAGGLDASAIGANGQIVPLSGALEEDDTKKVFQFEKKDILQDAKPLKSFNNIPYPY